MLLINLGEPWFPYDPSLNLHPSASIGINSK
jgi:hypothetical protein